MSNKIGRFEILSEIASTGSALLYKAAEGEGGQTFALKVLNLEGVGESAPGLLQTLVEEVEAGKALKSGNIAQTYEVEEIEGKIVAVMEYVQGNSIATMLARKEGFSIWDLQDIARQSCQALDHANTRKVVHSTLEPDKVMVTWDGSTKLLGYGISKMNASAVQAAGKPPAVLQYMSPEQLRGEPLDVRSNLFSLGAILYEMVTERKAFEGEDADQVRQQILEGMPTPPNQITRKANQALSELILKALSKDPGQRYQSGQELINDLEKCKSQPVAAVSKAAGPPRGFTSPVNAPAVARPAENMASPSSAKTQSPSEKPAPESIGVEAAPVASNSASTVPKTVPQGVATPKPAETRPKAAAAAAGWQGTGSAAVSRTTLPAENGELPLSAAAQSAQAQTAQESARMSAAAEVETFEKNQAHAPKVAVDPLMAEPAKPTGGIRSFSEIDELPPLKEVYVAPPSPAPAAEPEEPEQPEIIIKAPAAPPRKPSVPPRVVAKKAVNEIKKTPPQLFAYSIAAAVAIILLIVGGIAYHIHSENAVEDDLSTQSSVSEPAPAQTVAPAAPAAPVSAAASPQTQVPAPAPVAEEPPAEADHDISVRERRERRYKRRAASAPAIVPAQLTVNSTPAGAEVSVDGQTGEGWVTPFSATDLEPGQHTVVISKPGFASQTRTLQVGAGSKALLVIELAPMTAGVSLSSSPEAAEIFVDGHNTGHVTPAQVSVDKAGNHTFLLRKQGYLDETTTANVEFGQVLHLSSTLKPLGITDDIHYKKFLGGGKLPGQGTVSIKTDPKGAQVAVNRRVLERNTPVEFYLNPGNYIVDITMSGYKTIHRVIKVDRDGKVSIDEPLQNE
jgi:serine/threonine protein kinase